MKRRKARGLWVLFHLALLFPLVLLVVNYVQDNLTVNPIEQIQRRTGNYALNLLVLTLACTPLSKLPRLKPVLSLRRPLGLYAFLYASLHFLNFIGLDYGFNYKFIREGFYEKPFALVGFAALMTLLPLAVTATRGWRRRLGRHWGQLHWLVYPAALLAVLHFWWLVKANYSRPFV